MTLKEHFFFFPSRFFVKT